MKISRVLFLIVVVMLFLCLPVISHSGRTDSKGGHRNSATGEYHYHHGHSAHQHYDIDEDGILDCPYALRSSSPINSLSNTEEILISILVLAVFLFVAPLLFAYLCCRLMDFFNR